MLSRVRAFAEIACLTAPNNPKSATLGEIISQKGVRMKLLMFKFLAFLRTRLFYIFHLWCLWLLACIDRLILNSKLSAEYKKEASANLQDYYKKKTLKPLLKAAKLEIKRWQYAAILYPNTYCEKNAKIAQKRYNDMLNGVLGEDFAIRVVFKDEKYNKIPTNEDIKWAYKVLKRAGARIEF